MTAPRSPLTEIRSAELAAARAVAEATEAAEQAIAEARTAAVETVELARVQGRAAADEQFALVVDAAQAEAVEIADAVDGRVDGLRSRVEPQIDALALDMLDELLPGGGG